MRWEGRVSMSEEATKREFAAGCQPSKERLSRKTLRRMQTLEDAGEEGEEAKGRTGEQAKTSAIRSSVAGEQGKGDDGVGRERTP